MPRQTLEVQSVHRNYHVEFIDDTISQLTATIKQGDYLIVDKNVYDHYPEIAVLVDNCQHELVLSQESAKDFKALHTTIDRLLSVGFTKTDIQYTCLTGSNTMDPPMFLDRIAISEIIIKILYFYLLKSKSFIYENLIFRVALFVDFCTDILSQAYIFLL